MYIVPDAGREPEMDPGNDSQIPFDMEPEPEQEVAEEDTNF